MPQPAETIQEALDLLGPNGEHWIRGHAEQHYPDGSTSRCVVGALIAAAPDYADYEAAYQTVKDTLGGNIARWNNRDSRSFADVQATLRLARDRAMSPFRPGS